MASYYQESGRAGRDNKMGNWDPVFLALDLLGIIIFLLFNLAYCRMYYSKEDRDLLTFLIKQELEDKKNKKKVTHVYLFKK